jgi:hypothetical protein
MGPSEGYITTDDGILLFQKVGSGQKTVIIPNAIRSSSSGNVSRSYLFDDFKDLTDGQRRRSAGSGAA